MHMEMVVSGTKPMTSQDVQVMETCGTVVWAHLTKHAAIVAEVSQIPSPHLSLLRV